MLTEWIETPVASSPFACHSDSLIGSDLKLMYRAATVDLAELALAAFRAKYANTKRSPMSARHPVLRLSGGNPQDHGIATRPRYGMKVPKNPAVTSARLPCRTSSGCTNVSLGVTKGTFAAPAGTARAGVWQPSVSLVLFSFIRSSMVSLPSGATGYVHFAGSPASLRYTQTTLVVYSVVGPPAKPSNENSPMAAGSSGALAVPGLPKTTVPVYGVPKKVP